MERIRIARPEPSQRARRLVAQRATDAATPLACASPHGDGWDEDLLDRIDAVLAGQTGGDPRS